MKIRENAPLPSPQKDESDGVRWRAQPSLPLPITLGLSVGTGGERGGPGETLREASQAKLWVGPVPRVKRAGDYLMAFPGNMSSWLEHVLVAGAHLVLVPSPVIWGDELLSQAGSGPRSSAYPGVYRTWWQGEGAMF